MTRGSMQYWQKRRAYRRLPRLRAVLKGLKEPALSSIVGYKVGMTNLIMTEETQKSSDTNHACTVIEVPTTEMYGIRLYKLDKSTGYKRATKELYEKSSALRAGIKKISADKEDLNSTKQSIAQYSDVSALLAAHPKGTATGQHHPDRFEVAILGNSPSEKFEHAAKLLGKEVKPYDIFKNGEHIDVISISKGKGWAGVIKRFGVARLASKATQKVRHVGTLGSMGIARVLYEVPQSGQLGFNYRTEHNKRVLKIGKKEESGSINPKSGFINYGNVVADYMIIDGSVPGPAKRLVRIRKSVDNRDSKGGIKEPKINYIATTGKGI